MKIVIVTGGTGGHIYPALALAEFLKRSNEHQILFIGTARRLEATIIPEAGYDFHAIAAYGLVGNIFKRSWGLFLTYLSHFKCRRILKQFQADIVVGFGGYVSFPVVLAAKQLKLPIVLHEQNALAGKANLFLAKYATNVVVSYPSTVEQFPAGKALFYGNPRASLVNLTNNDRHALLQLGLRSDLKTVLIVMGSLGSATVNQIVAETLPMFAQKNYQIIFLTGTEHFLAYQHLQTTNVKVVSYLDLLDFFGKIDLIVMRGGATTAAEVMAAGLPSIIIPSPYVANNHQVVNATEMVRSQAALMILEADLTPTSLFQAVDAIISDRNILAQMSINAKLLSQPQAAERLVQLIESLVETKK